MSRLTVFLARSIGLFTILLVAGLLVRGGAAIETTAADGPVMLGYAIISLAMGVAMVVGHNLWSGGALPLVVAFGGMVDPRQRPSASRCFARGAWRNDAADAIRRTLPPCFSRPRW